MDLVQTVRKEGSRGGRGDFKWEDVANDAHRENYLGHSLMAPVGRWQKGRDLNWYAKADASPAAQAAAEARAEELRRIKEAEEDAMAAALGLPVPQRNNANMVPLGGKASDAEVKKALAETGAGDEEQEGVKGLGFGGYEGRAGASDGEGEVLAGEGFEASGLAGSRSRPKADTERRDRDRRRSHSRDRDRDRRKRDRRDRDGDESRRSRSRSRERERRHRRRSRSRSRERHRHSRREIDRERERGSHRSRSRDRRRPRDDDEAPRRRRRDSPDERSRSRSRDRDERRWRRSRSPYRDGRDRRR